MNIPSRFPQILLISHIAEMQGEFAGTLVIEPDTGNASRVREAGGKRETPAADPAGALPEREDSHYYP
jgi:hypothetical protein